MSSQDRPSWRQWRWKPAIWTRAIKGRHILYRNWIRKT